MEVVVFLKSKASCCYLKLRTCEISPFNQNGNIFETVAQIHLPQVHIKSFQNMVSVDIHIIHRVGLVVDSWRRFTLYQEASSVLRHSNSDYLRSSLHKVFSFHKVYSFWICQSIPVTLRSQTLLLPSNHAAYKHTTIPTSGSIITA